ncbi:MAG: superoxide dismutase [Phycisphaerales bacterium]|nr:superoxide dismutase [Phycisphaerales bacterium]
MTFTLPDLPYAEDALEPAIDARTMNIHHSKHHAGYVAKLNAAIEGTDLEGKTIEELCSGIKNLPADVQGAVRNNGGGHFNHSLFWKSLAAPGTGGAPSAELAAAIDGTFGSMDGFKKAFADAAATRFGSGWAWLCTQGDGELCVCSSANQDNPLMVGIVECPGTPILGLDVWEHAYYLNYQNRRPDYITAFWDVVNWDEVSRRFTAQG